MTKTKYQLAIWTRQNDGVVYGFPAGVDDAWGGEVLAMINEQNWTFNCTLPAGLPMSVLEDLGKAGVRIKVAGRTVITADWALV